MIKSFYRFINENWLNEGNNMPMYLSNDEVEKLYPDLHQAMQYWIISDVLYFTTDEGESESEYMALCDFWEESRYNNYYRIYPADGSVTVAIYKVNGSRTKKDFNFSWDDENGKEHTANALDYLDREFEIQTKFDDADPIGKISYNKLPALAEHKQHSVKELIAKYELNNMTPVKWAGKKYGI